LARLANSEGLVDLEGALAATRSAGSSGLKRGLPVWSRVSAARGAPVLLPRLPSPEGISERWRARGVGVWLSDGLALIEAPGGSLSAHDPQSGDQLWRLPSIRDAAPLVGDDLEDVQDERVSTLSWAVAPWGAVELVAEYHAPFRRRRAGRWHADLGRVTESVPTERSETEVRIGVQVLLADGGRWSASRRPPERIVERTDPAEPLADSSLHVREWFEELLSLSLDPIAPGFAVSWGVPTLNEQWTVLDVADGVLGPAGWEPDDGDPFARPSPASCPGPLGTTFRVRGDRLLHERGDELLKEHSLSGLANPRLIAADGAVLVSGSRGRTSHVLRLDWDADAPRPWPPHWPESFDGRVGLVGWDAAPANDELFGQLLVAGGLLFVQQGGDSLICFGPDPRA
jgi:hypothetical protein